MTAFAIALSTIAAIAASAWHSVQVRRIEAARVKLEDDAVIALQGRAGALEADLASLEARVRKTELGRLARPAR